MLKRMTFICFVPLCLLIILPCCMNIDEKKELIYQRGPSWEQFDQACRNVYHKKGKDIQSKVIIFMMLYAKTDIGSNPEQEASLDNKGRIRYRMPSYNKLLKNIFVEERQYSGETFAGGPDHFGYLLYGAIASRAVRVSFEDVYQLVRRSNPGILRTQYYYEDTSYSEDFAKTLLLAYATPQYEKLLDSVSHFWFCKLRAACVLGYVSMAKEILNEHSNEFQKQGYNRLLRDACRCNKLEMVKFLISNIISQNNKHVKIQEIDFEKLLAIAKEKNHQECIAYLESMNNSDQAKFQLRENRKLAEKKKFEEQELVNIYQIAAKSASDMKNNSITGPYSKNYAMSLLQAYAIPENQALFNQIDKFWFIRLRATCSLGDIAKAEEILNEYSEKCTPEDYILLIMDACYFDNSDMVKFLLPAVSNTAFSRDLAQACLFSQEISKLKETERTLVAYRIGLNKILEMGKTLKLATAFRCSLAFNGRCLSLLLEKFPLDPKNLVFLMEWAVKVKNNATATGNVFCLTKKFEESRDRGAKSYFIDCSTPLIQGNTAVLKELMRVGIQISLGSLPAIIADNGQTVLSSIDAVMVGKTPLMLASKEMDKAMLAAAATGNVKVLKKLIQYGGEVNCMDENEKSPLAIAKEKNHEECIAFLESVNAVSSKFQLRNIRREIEAKRKNYAANFEIRKYTNDLSLRQTQMLKDLSETERLLVQTLLQAKIYDNLSLRKVQKLKDLSNIGGSGAELEAILLNQTRLDNVRIYLTFARAKVFKTEDRNRFEILIYPELSPESKKMIKDMESRITNNKASWDDRVVYDLIRNVNWSENAKYITVLLDGEMIRILKSPPDIIVDFRTPPASAAQHSGNRTRIRNSIPRNRKRSAGTARP